MEQQEVEIIPQKIKKILRKMPNWKALGPGSKILKVFKKILEETCKNDFENGNLLMWITKGRNILMQKNKEKGKAASN